MDLHDGSSPQERFRAYATDLASVLGHADRVRPFEDYCVGLLSTEGRKSVEPLAATTAPERTAAQHQSLLHFVAQAPWSDQALLTRVREQVLPSITSEEPIQAWIIDDTGFPKKGSHSVGVARQYCGQLGKQDNCQVAVSLSVATHQGSLPIAYRLYLPKDWAGDPLRRAIAGVPADVLFQTKAGDCLAAVAPGGGGWRAARRRADGPGLWQRQQTAGWDQSTWANLCGRHFAHHDALAARRGTVAACVPSGPRPPRHAVAPRRDASAGIGQDAGSGASRRGLADDHLARRQQCAADFAVCPVAGPPGARRYQPDRTRRGGVAVDRVARGRNRTGSLLALHDGRRRQPRTHGRSCQAPLANRA
jgi:DDE superfamily endonuclease